MAVLFDTLLNHSMRLAIQNAKLQEYIEIVIPILPILEDETFFDIVGLKL